MHSNSKLAPKLRKEIYDVWKKEKCSLRDLGDRYHVDKRVIGRIIERGKRGDFSLHDSTNKRYLKKPASGSKKKAKVTKRKAVAKRSRARGTKRT
jgi:topoisomerase IA-like protein